jgi:hypothetical protein
MNLPDIDGMYKEIAGIPKIARGLVWCIKCGAWQPVNSGACLRSGWPKCCGYTMTIDSPEELSARAKGVAK